MILTRKDYKAIAKILYEELMRHRSCRNDCHVGCIGVNDDLLERLADYMDADSPNFDRARFIKACYGEEE